MFKKILCSVILFTAFGAFATAEALSLSENLDQIAKDVSAKYPLAGMSVAVTYKGQPLLDKGYGMADIEAQRPADANTVYAIGSMTKQFTAVAVLQLVSAGLLDLDSDIHVYVPEYPARKPAVTLRTLLTHTSGVPDYFPTEEAELPALFKPITHGEVLKRFADRPLDFTPGANFAYSNSNFFLLGIAIERVSGESFNGYLQRHVFQPMALEIYECGSPEIAVQMARGYVLGSAGQLQASPDFDFSWAYAAGNLCATTGAILKWNQILHHGSLLTTWAYSTMTTVAVLSDGTSTTAGAGLFIDTLQGHRHIEHSGGTLTFNSQNAYLPDDDLSIVILTNTNAPFDRVGLERTLAREVLGLKSPAQTPLPVPADLSARIAGTYHVPGRAVFPSDPVTIKAVNDKVFLSIAGRDIELLYLGAGKFVLDAGPRNTYLTFAPGGSSASFSLFYHEMLMARGMRSPDIL